MIRNPFSSPFETAFEQGQSLIQKTSDAAKQQVSLTGQSITSQITGSATGVNDQTQDNEIKKMQTQEFIKELYAPSKKQNQVKQPLNFKQQIGFQNDEIKNVSSLKQQFGLENKDNTKPQGFLEQIGLESSKNSSASLSQQLGLTKINIARTPEEQAQLEKTRKELQQMHESSYYKPTFIEKPKIEDQKEEKEKKQQEQEEEQKKMEKLEEEKKEKEKSFALQRAQRTAEMHRGVAG